MPADTADSGPSSWPSGWAVADSLPPGAEGWLRETAQLDLSEPKLRITAQKLTQSRQTLAERAAAIHAFVRRMPFSAAPAGSGVRASEVLREARGDCHSKGVLFTALCRAAELPARLLFVDVRPRFLHGILDAAPVVMPHAVGQVLVAGVWWSTDGYVVDPALFALAKQLLRDEELDCGWGVVADAHGSWDGRSHCLHQFREADVVRNWGAFDDPAQFYATCGRGSHDWLGRMKYALGAQLVNRRIRQLRDEG
jgi:transglutaminase-like putative cysteine protease